MRAAAGIGAKRMPVSHAGALYQQALRKQLYPARAKTMRTTRKTETTIELRETVVVRGSAEAWEICAKCAPSKAIMVSIEDAAVLAGLPPRIIYRWVEAGAIHCLENEAGWALVCLRSVLDASNGKSQAEGQPQQPKGTGGWPDGGSNSSGELSE